MSLGTLALGIVTPSSGDGKGPPAVTAEEGPTPSRMARCCTSDMRVPDLRENFLILAFM